MIINIKFLSINQEMDEHTIKKKRYLNRLFAITSRFSDMLAPLVEIVKAYPVNVLDELFFNMEHSGSDLYIIYKTECNENTAYFVRYILNN
jgi:hypothetical protein